ncbi:MAG: SigB/SigF/SigG family RNA polymerase sigma factor [Oscillospiraceae bacterium]|nr:SigB/SigF/SigG family RNA polymerase sigma factor [Oscillospiraceae bacterium]
MYYKKVEISGVDTAHLPDFTEQERNELIEKMRRGDTNAKDMLVIGNLKLVLSIIQRFRYKNVDFDDLFQVGCIGLIKALNNFDTSLNVQFSTYGVVMILGEIKRFIRDDQPVKVSRSIKDLAYKAVAAKERLTDTDGNEPTLQEIAEELDCSSYQVSRALEALSPSISLYESVYNDDSSDVYLLDQISSENFEEAFQSKIIMQDVLHNLKQREKHIMNLRFIKGKTQTEVAREIGISQAQVSRIEKSVIGYIKSQLEI